MTLFQVTVVDALITVIGLLILFSHPNWMIQIAIAYMVIIFLFYILQVSFD